MVSRPFPVALLHPPPPLPTRPARRAELGAAGAAGLPHPGARPQVCGVWALHLLHVPAGAPHAARQAAQPEVGAARGGHELGCMHPRPTPHATMAHRAILKCSHPTSLQCAAECAAHRHRRAVCAFGPHNFSPGQTAAAAAGPYRRAAGPAVRRRGCDCGQLAARRFSLTCSLYTGDKRHCTVNRQQRARAVAVGQRLFDYSEGR